MSTQWYYVQGKDRVGPIEQDEVERLFGDGTLTEESFVWRKGFSDWQHLSKVEDLAYLLEKQMPEASDFDEDSSVDAIPMMGGGAPNTQARPSFDIHQIADSAKVFSIKVGYDRGGHETEYGPFSLKELSRAYDENRINEKTFIFTPGMSTWKLLGDFERFDEIAGGVPPSISEADRRVNVRKPFIARLLFHDNKEVYEGICRDISVGGLQVLVSGFPCEVGEKISMNVHPDNSDHHFTASGKVVRVLEGQTGFSLRFEDLSGEAQSAIQSYINEN